MVSPTGPGRELLPHHENVAMCTDDQRARDGADEGAPDEVPPPCTDDNHRGIESPGDGDERVCDLSLLGSRRVPHVPLGEQRRGILDEHIRLLRRQALRERLAPGAEEVRLGDGDHDHSATPCRQDRSLEQRPLRRC